MNISGYGAYDPMKMQQQIQDKFKTADKDGNGGVSIDELKGAVPEGMDTSKMESMFQQMDSNGDGELSQKEREAAMQMMQDRMQMIQDKMQSFSGNLQSGDSEEEDPFSTLLEALANDQENGSKAKDELQGLMERLATEGRTEENMQEAAQFVHSLIPNINIDV